MAVRGTGEASLTLRIDPIVCEGRGLCAELLPELFELDDWGFPDPMQVPVPNGLQGLARRAEQVCPTLAIRLERRP